MAPPSEQELIDQIKNSISGMQNEMKNTYERLSSEDVIGTSGEQPDPYVKVIMKANYEFVDILFDKKALAGGVTEFQHRIKIAFQDAVKQVQSITQKRTMELLQGMNIPQNLQQGLNQQTEGDDGDS